ncbi:MAG TPA: hypothetical protein VMJ10_13515 [Kofleriaceae bacterium]|nr:hypothetical protein [Kofleriaceae bacterium]
MARHTAVIAGFAAACAVVLSIGSHSVDASIEHDGRHVRPLQQSAVFAGAEVKVDVDRNLVLTGDSVVVTMRAFADVPTPVDAELEVYYSNDEWGGRVSSPPKAIDKEHITLAAAPGGGKPVQTRIKLDGAGKLDTYRIFVHERGGELDIWAKDSAEVAAVDVLGWSGNDFELSIDAPKKIVAGKPFAVTVRATNTTGKRIKHAPYIHLGTAVGLYGITDREEFAIQEDDSDDHAERYEKGFAPGEDAVERFIVTPLGDTELTDVTFVASAYVWPDDGAAPLAGGAMEAKTVRFVPPAKKLAVR